MKNIVFFFIIFFLLSPAHPIHAQTPTSTPIVADPCNPDAPLSVPCPVKYDSTNTVIPREKTWVSSLLQSIANSLHVEFNWAGSLRPSNDTYNIGSEKFTTYGQQILQSSETDLKPAALQVVTTPDLQPKPFTMTSVVCATDPETGKVTQISSPDRIESKDIPGLTQAIEGSRQLGSYVTGYTQTSQDYNLKNVVVSTASVACDTGDASGQPIKQTAVTTQNQNSYGEGSTIQTVVSLVHLLITKIEGLFQAEVKQTAQIQGKAVTPWMHYSLCLFAGCGSADVAGVSYDTDQNKKQLTQAGGAVAAMYKPAAVDDTYKSKLNAATDQEWTITGAGDQTEQKAETAVNYGQARVTAAGDYMNCTLMPADYQNTAVPDGACNTNWVNTAATVPPTAGGWNCDTSVPPQSVPGLIDAALAKQKVDNWYYGCPNATNNAWGLCMNDVVATANRACVDPLFALFVWIHESGVSNYQCGEALTGGTPVEDFGIHSADPRWPPENFSAQLDKFVLKPSEYIGLCPDLTFQNFMALYAKGHCYNDLSQADKDSVTNLINVDYKNLYDWFAPGVPVPTTWPIISGCTPS
ncbi:MAG: hypothetical protein NTY06_04300 [Candidatus Gottesmanbacteria bacterium]|nr:hypothetical protein [Candidatus Gottesmanbacteria bacterium]